MRFAAFCNALAYRQLRYVHNAVRRSVAGRCARHLIVIMLLTTVFVVGLLLYFYLISLRSAEQVVSRGCEGIEMATG